jgi:hypothetical protein
LLPPSAARECWRCSPSSSRTSAPTFHSLVYCFQHLNQPNELIVLLASIFPPIGVIHGWLLWFGVVAV